MNFTDVTREAGLSEQGSIMGVGDLNQDGHADLICLDFKDSGARQSVMVPVFYLNDGKGKFRGRPGN